jgi:hypothetical protein
MSQMVSMANVLDRHLRSKTVSPFFWITAEGILGREVVDFPAVKEGLALAVFVNDKPRTVPGWEEAKEIEDGNSRSRQFHSIMVRFSAAKRNPMIQHLSSSESDGLCCFVPTQTTEEGLVNVGYEPGRAAKFNARSLRGDTLDTYLWRKATTKIIAASEAMQLVPGLGMRMTTVEQASDGVLQGTFRGTVAEVLGNVVVEAVPMQPTGTRTYKAPAFNRETRRYYGSVLAATNVNRGVMGRAGSAFTSPPTSAYGSALGINFSKVHTSKLRRERVRGKGGPAPIKFKVPGVEPTSVRSGRLRHKTGRRGPKKKDKAPLQSVARVARNRWGRHRQPRRRQRAIRRSRMMRLARRSLSRLKGTGGRTVVGSMLTLTSGPAMRSTI